MKQVIYSVLACIALIIILSISVIWAQKEEERLYNNHHCIKCGEYYHEVYCTNRTTTYQCPDCGFECTLSR